LLAVRPGSRPEPSPHALEEIRVWRNPDDGLEYVRVPAGRFTMGCETAQCPPTQLPLHVVTLEQPFFLGRTEVTVGAFRRFAAATSRPLPAAPEFNPDWQHAEHPMVNVDWQSARDYCAWAGGRLPSEAE